MNFQPKDAKYSTTQQRLRTPKDSQPKIDEYGRFVDGRAGTCSQITLNSLPMVDDQRL
jgi:hypothetical protein